MKNFIELVGKENYDKLVHNRKIQEGKYENGVPFSDHAPVVRIVCPYEKEMFKDENDFCLLSEVSDGCNAEDVFGYGICTFTNGFPKIGLIKIADIMAFKGYRNTALTVDKDFKPETTIGGYLSRYETNGVYRNRHIPLYSWREILTEEGGVCEKLP